MPHNYLDEAAFIAQRTRSTRVVRFFPNADLRCGHEGLAKIAMDNGVNARELSPGEFLVFANGMQNKLKIYAPGNLIAYLKSPDNRRIDLDIIRYLPRFFNGTEFEYDKAVKKVLLKKLAA